MADAPVILFEDVHCLAVVKPAGQFTQGDWAPPGERSLESEVRSYLNATGPVSVYLGIVHRLDRPTSGVLLWAKTPKAARRLSAQFERRRVVKEYWAVVPEPASATAEGSSGDVVTSADDLPRPFAGDEMIWRDWLTRANAAGIVSAHAGPVRGAREAITRVRRQAAVAPPGFSWLRLWPETGRTHQLRAQAAGRGMSIMGDEAYGSALRFSRPNTIALHARMLRVRHPITNDELTLVAPLPATWAEAGIVLPAIDERGGA